MSVDALSILAGARRALVDIDVAVGAVESGVAAALERVRRRDAVAVVARVAGAPIHLCAMTTCQVKCHFNSCLFVKQKQVFQMRLFIVSEP